MAASFVSNLRQLRRATKRTTADVRFWPVADIHSRCPLLARSRHCSLRRTCPLSKVKRTWPQHIAFRRRRLFPAPARRNVPDDGHFIGPVSNAIWRTSYVGASWTNHMLAPAFAAAPAASVAPWIFADLSDILGLAPFWPVQPAATADRSATDRLRPLASLRRLWAVQTRAHSARTFSKPRNRNWRNPRACLICPNTGSGSCLRSR